MASAQRHGFVDLSWEDAMPYAQNLFHLALQYSFDPRAGFTGKRRL
jgi:hypothetical protein